MTDIQKLAKLMEEAEKYAEQKCDLDCSGCANCPAVHSEGDCEKWLAADYLIENGVRLQER
jgi:hypothetical protein